MSNFTILQRINSIVTSIDRAIILLRNSTPQPTITPLQINSSSLIINFMSIPCKTFSIKLTSNLDNIIFQNSVINGSYTIYIYGSNHIIKKHLGTNILTNLNGDVMVNGMFICNVYYDGKNYYMRFTNFNL